MTKRRALEPTFTEVVPIPEDTFQRDFCGHMDFIDSIRLDLVDYFSKATRATALTAGRHAVSREMVAALPDMKAPGLQADYGALLQISAFITNARAVQWEIGCNSGATIERLGIDKMDAAISFLSQVIQPLPAPQGGPQALKHE